MSLYVDTSALMKRYVREPDSAVAHRLLDSDSTWVSGRHLLVEARRNLARLLSGSALERARVALREDVETMHLVPLSDTVCDLAAHVAESTGAKTLDALHVACAMQAEDDALLVVTFDFGLAQAARQMGLRVNI